MFTLKFQKLVLRNILWKIGKYEIPKVEWLEIIDKKSGFKNFL